MRHRRRQVQTRRKCIYDPSSGEIILDSLHFTNDDKGFKTLLANLKKNKDSNILISFESTGHYHQTLFNFLTAHHFKCYLINPYMTSKFRSISLRDAKNDNIDSRVIAQFLSFEYKELFDEEYKVNELKELTKERSFLMTDSSKMKIKLKSYLDRVFRELEGIVNVNTKAIRAILKEYPIARDVFHTRIDRLKNIASNASRADTIFPKSNS